MGDVAIRLEGVSKFYKLYNSPGDRLKEALSISNKVYHEKYYALNNINLEVKKGEILGIVGKNGCGKSTLLKLIAGVLTPNEGEIKVHGKISALLELGSGFNPEFTGLQNIFFYGAILGFSKDEMNDKLDDIIGFADIGDFIYQPLKMYSSGMRSRLGFSVAIHVDPEILILDEVLSVGDEQFKRKCYAKMEEFFRGGKTILYVSHDVNSVRSLCSKAIFLDSSELLLSGDAKFVTSHYQRFLYANENSNKSIRLAIASMENNSNEKAGVTAVQDEKPYSILMQNNADLDVGDVQLKTCGSEITNVLERGVQYYCEWEVCFPSNFSQVRFGFSVKNIKGVNISGALYPALKSFNVQKREQYRVRFYFRCEFLPATYFINLNVVDGENVLCSIIDATSFKVVEGDAESEMQYVGMVSLIEKVDIIKYSL